MNKGQIQLKVEIRAVKTMWTFHVIEDLQFPCIIGVDFLKENEVDLKFSSQAIIINKESKTVQPLQTEISFDKDVEESDLNEVKRGKSINFLTKDSDLFSDNSAKFNRHTDHREDSQNVVADARSRNSESSDIESKSSLQRSQLIRFNLHGSS